MWQYNHIPSANELYHYGVKGMKWGVRRTREQLGHRMKNTVYSTVTGHSPAPKKSAPFSVIDHIGHDGKIDSRSFYDENGWKWKDIHSGNHGNPKQHSYGKNGEHVVLYFWKETGALGKKEHRELVKWEREENRDIL